MNKSEIIFILGILFGNISGFFLCGLFSANKIDQSWHDGFRAGKYGKRNTINL